MDPSSFLSGTTDIVRSLVSLVSSTIAVGLGVWCAFSALRKMIAHAQGHRQGQPTAGPVLGQFALAAIFVQFSTMVDQLTQSVFGEARESPSAAMQYMPAQVSQSTALSQLVNAGVLWVFAIGFVAILRGLILWNELANGNPRSQDNGWKGFWHIFFGCLATNLPGVLKLFSGNN